MDSNFAPRVTNVKMHVLAFPDCLYVSFFGQSSMRSHLTSLSLCSLLCLGATAPTVLAQPLQSTRIAQATNPSAIAQSVDQIAAAVTVRIDSKFSGNGSGVIVSRNGSTYTVLTAEHVIGNADEYSLVTPDGQSYPLNPKNIKAQPGLDLAVIQFSSDKAYQTATLGNYDFTIEDRPIAFLSGFPGTEDDSEPQREFTIGTVFPTTVTLFAAQNAYSFASGRELVYTSKSKPGMSGGPVFDQLGRVIGIHNASETQLEADQSGLVFPMNIGRSLGVPIRSYLGSGSQLSSLQVQTTPPRRLSETQISQILSQVNVPAPEEDIASEWLRYGNHLWRVRRYDQAINATQKALNLDPTLYQAYYVQGLAYNAQQQPQKAISAFNTAIQSNPKFYDGWRQKALSYFDLKQYDEALTAINKAIAIQSDDAGLYLIKGNILRSQGQLTEARETFRRSLSLKPSAFAYLQRGTIAVEQGDYNPAKADFNQAIKLQPQDYFGYMARGLMESAFGSPQQAIADFNQAQSLVPPKSPSLSLILMSKGLGHISLDQPTQAIAATTEAIQRFIPNKSPDAIRSQSYLLRSLAYRQTQNLPLAIADLTTLIQQQPDNAEYFQKRGGYYIQAKDPQRAILDFNRAIALDSQLASAYQERGLAYQTLQQFGAAQQDFSKAIALLTQQINQQPNELSSATLYLGRAQAYVGIMNVNAAKQDLLSAEKLFTSRGISTGALFDTIQKLKQILQQLG